MTDIDLKKYCIEKAAGSADLVATARELYKFLAPVEVVQTESVKPIIRKWNPSKLTKTQKAVLQVAINIFNSNEKLNGVSLAAKLKFTQSNASTHLKNLVKVGYMKRVNGKEWRPIYDSAGQELPPVLTVCPPRAAKGYNKPLTAPLGRIAGMKR